MTLEELKEEAKKFDYKVAPIKKYIRRSPCMCGNKRPYLWGDGALRIWYCRCQKCGLESDSANTRDKAQINWNAMVAEKRASES